MTDLITNLAFSLIVAAVGTALFTGILVPLAPRVGLVQAPGAHRAHARPTPLIGGLALFCGFVLGVLTLDAPLGGMRALFATGFILVTVGLLDDLHELSTRYRFAAQTLAALLMVFWGGVVLRDLGQLIGPDVLVLGLWAVPLTVFATVGVMNAANMSDGTDGQAGVLVSIAVAFLVFFSWDGGGNNDTQILALLLACVLAFLAFNLPSPGRRGAVTFMGDAGSLFLGLVLAWYLVKFSQGPERLIAPVTALWLLALPLCDAVAVMLRRLLERSSPFVADRTHYHHLLLALGLSPGQALGVIAALAATLAGVGAAGEILGIPESTRFWGFLGWFAVYFLATSLLVRRGRDGGSAPPPTGRHASDPGGEELQKLSAPGSVGRTAGAAVRR